MHNKSNKLNISVIIVAVLLMIAYINPFLWWNFEIRVPFFMVLRIVIHMGLLVAWTVSIYNRIIHAQVRRYLIYIAVLMMFWISVKTLKYNVIDNNAALERILWYSYYIPLLFIPTIGVLIALSLGKPESYKLPKRANILIVCAAILVLLVMTNDFHNLVFSFRPEDFRLHDEYSYSMAFWFVLAWEILAGIVAFVLLIIKCRIPRSHTVLWLPIFTFLLTIIYGVLYMANFSPIRLLVDDMTATLCILFVAIWESCIKSGLIQANTHYGELLHSSTIGARITDESFKVIYSAENTMSFKVENLKSAAGEPVIFWDRGVRLSGASIQGGYVF